MTAWRTVPVEPTPEMLRAGAGHQGAYCWAVMLGAAPEPPASELERAAAALAVRVRNEAPHDLELERLQAVLEGLR